MYKLNIFFEQDILNIIIAIIDDVRVKMETRSEAKVVKCLNSHFKKNF